MISNNCFPGVLLRRVNISSSPLFRRSAMFEWTMGPLLSLPTLLPSSVVHLLGWKSFLSPQPSADIKIKDASYDPRQETTRSPNYACSAVSLRKSLLSLLAVFPSPSYLYAKEKRKSGNHSLLRRFYWLIYFLLSISHKTSCNSGCQRTSWKNCQPSPSVGTPYKYFPLNCFDQYNKS